MPSQAKINLARRSAQGRCAPVEDTGDLTAGASSGLGPLQVPWRTLSSCFGLPVGGKGLCSHKSVDLRVRPELQALVTSCRLWSPSHMP